MIGSNKIFTNEETTEKYNHPTEKKLSHLVSSPQSQRNANVQVRCKLVMRTS